MQISVVTSNILFANPKDGKHDWPHRKDLLAKILLEQSPTIVGTQEGRRPQLTELEELLKGLVLQEENRDWIDNRMYPCLYCDLSKVDVIQSGDRWLSSTPTTPGSSDFESQFPRLMSFAHLQAKTGQELFVACTHLDHVKSTTREKQTEVLIEQIKHLRPPKSSLIVLGDFNESPQEKVRELLMHAFPELNDPHLQFFRAEQATHHQFGAPLEHAKRIDWILASKELDCVHYDILKTHRDGIYPSDHFPVVARFKLAQ